MSNSHLLDNFPTRYGQLTCFANDIGAVTQSIKMYGEWAENELSFLKKLIPAGGTVVDAGAFIGTHTLAFSCYVGKNGKVIAIEPQPATFEILTKNVCVNELGNVVLKHALASDKIEKILIKSFKVDQEDSFGSISQNRSGALPSMDPQGQDEISEESIPVDAITIDSLSLVDCSLIKIDTEGYEDIVLKGAMQTIQNFHPFIYAECNSIESGVTTIGTMGDTGYKFFLHVVDAFNPENFNHNSEDIFSSGREAALLGVHASKLKIFEQLKPRECELILDIETADDIAIGMLNKPQYSLEILQKSAAAQSGGLAWLEDTQLLTVRLSQQLDRTQQALEDAQALARERAVEIDRIAQQLDRTQQAFEEVQALAYERVAEVDRISQQLDRTQQAFEEVQALAYERTAEIDRLSQLLNKT